MLGKILGKDTSVRHELVEKGTDLAVGAIGLCGAATSALPLAVPLVGLVSLGAQIWQSSELSRRKKVVRKAEKRLSQLGISERGAAAALQLFAECSEKIELDPVELARADGELSIPQYLLERLVESAPVPLDDQVPEALEEILNIVYEEVRKDEGFHKILIQDQSRFICSKLSQVLHSNSEMKRAINSIDEKIQKILDAKAGEGRSEKSLYPVTPVEITKNFADLLTHAGRHLQSSMWPWLRKQSADREVHTEFGGWLRNEAPIFCEHFSFRLGSQIFFVQCFDVSKNQHPELNPDALDRLANEANGIACLLPMINSHGEWRAAYSGWGLIGTDTLPLNPDDYIPNSKAVMSDWEVHDFGLQVVRSQIEGDGYRVISWQPNPRVNPSITCEKNGRVYGVVVRTSRKVNVGAQRPDDVDSFSKALKSKNILPMFASVRITSANDEFDNREVHVTRRIHRGDPIYVNYRGLEPLVHEKL